MPPFLDDPPCLEHDNLVGVAHGRNAMRDDDGRAILHHAAQARQNFFLGVRVHSGERVIQNQNARIGHHGTRDGGALLLPARQRDAALADHRLVAARKVSNVFVELGHHRCGFESRRGFLRDRRDAECDVVGERVGKQKRLLWHEADHAAQIPQRNVADIAPVDEDSPPRRILQPR